MLSQRKKEKRITSALNRAIRELTNIFVSFLRSKNYKHDIIQNTNNELIDVYVEESDRFISLYIWIPNHMDSSQIDVAVLNSNTLLLISREIGPITKIVLNQKIRQKNPYFYPKASSLKIVVEKKKFKLL